MAGDTLAIVGSDVAESDATDVAAVETELRELDVVVDPPDPWDPRVTADPFVRPSGTTGGRRGGAGMIAAGLTTLGWSWT